MKIRCYRERDAGKRGSFITMAITNGRRDMLIARYSDMEEGVWAEVPVLRIVRAVRKPTDVGRSRKKLG